MSELLALGLIACASALVGLLFNGYIVLILVSNRQMRTANNLLLLHLALVGILSCVEFLSSTVPFIIRNTTDELTTAPISTTTTTRHTVCVTHGFIFTALLPIVVWTLCGLNCDRYMAIASPLHYSRLMRRKRIILFVMFTWLIGVTLAVPPLFHIKPYTHHKDRALCLADFTESTSGSTYPFAYVSLAIVIPALLIFICNVRILAIARHHRHRIVSAIYEVTIRAQATITHQRNPFYLNKYRNRCAIVTIFQLIGSLLVLYGPYCGVMFWELMTGTRCPPIWAAIAVLLVAFAAPLNGFVYGLKSPVLRKTFKNFLRKQLYTSEVRNEIQRRGSVSNRGWTAVAFIASRIQTDVKSRSESPMLSSARIERTTAAVGRDSLVRSRSEGVLVHCRINVPSSPIHANCNSSSSVEVGFHLFDVPQGEPDVQSFQVPAMTKQKTSTTSTDKLFYRNNNNNIKRNNNLVRVHSLTTDRKFSWERLRNGRLKRSLRKVFSPPKLLAERGSI